MKTKQLMKSYESVLTDKQATRNKKTTADASSNTPDVSRFFQPRQDKQIVLPQANEEPRPWATSELQKSALALYSTH